MDGPTPPPQAPTPPSRDATAPPAPDGQPPYVASCGNCTRFVENNCSLGRVLAPGKLLCNDYEITPTFRDELVRVMMKDIMAQTRETTKRVTQLRAAQRLWN